MDASGRVFEYAAGEVEYRPGGHIPNTRAPLCLVEIGPYKALWVTGGGRLRGPRRPDAQTTFRISDGTFKHGRPGGSYGMFESGVDWEEDGTHLTIPGRIEMLRGVFVGRTVLFPYFDRDTGQVGVSEYDIDIEEWTIHDGVQEEAEGEEVREEVREGEEEAVGEVPQIAGSEEASEPSEEEGEEVATGTEGEAGDGVDGDVDMGAGGPGTGDTDRGIGVIGLRPCRRISPAVFGLGGRLWLVGGVIEIPDDNDYRMTCSLNALSDAWTYDPWTRVWQRQRQPPQEVVAPACTMIGGHMHLFGGNHPHFGNTHAPKHAPQYRTHLSLSPEGQWTSHPLLPMSGVYLCAITSGPNAYLHRRVMGDDLKFDYDQCFMYNTVTGVCVRKPTKKIHPISGSMVARLSATDVVFACGGGEMMPRSQDNGVTRSAVHATLTGSLVLDAACCATEVEAYVGAPDGSWDEVVGSLVEGVIVHSKYNWDISLPLLVLLGHALIAVGEHDLTESFMKAVRQSCLEPQIEPLFKEMIQLPDLVPFAGPSLPLPACPEKNACRDSVYSCPLSRVLDLWDLHPSLQILLGPVLIAMVGQFADALGKSLVPSLVLSMIATRCPQLVGVVQCQLRRWLNNCVYAIQHVNDPDSDDDDEDQAREPKHTHVSLALVSHGMMGTVLEPQVQKWVMSVRAQQPWHMTVAETIVRRHVRSRPISATIRAEMPSDSDIAILEALAGGDGDDATDEESGLEAQDTNVDPQQMLQSLALLSVRAPKFLPTWVDLCLPPASVSGLTLQLDPSAFSSGSGVPHLLRFFRRVPSVTLSGLPDTSPRWAHLANGVVAEVALLPAVHTHPATPRMDSVSASGRHTTQSLPLSRRPCSMEVEGVPADSEKRAVLDMCVIKR
ncbi:hypothetical protein KIPB_007816 [Kipferlia bialata]|uniref:Kelch-type beta propeller n=1 Tax=Kipferlia bialata TaxID=797122 RepID=A0A9K3CZK0_9EUKA|nr:hypothetical protein KIPB_007816 [Kipferlia bialata]|eukprot:g7816.t1